MRASSSRGLRRAVREDRAAGLDTRRRGAITRRCAEPGAGLPLLHRQLYVHVESYLIASAYTVLVFLVRLLVLVLTLPLFLMAAFTGLVDGLVRRDVRGLRRRARIGLRLPPGEASLMPLAVCPGSPTCAAGQRASAADPAAQRGAARRRVASRRRRSRNTCSRICRRYGKRWLAGSD